MIALLVAGALTAPPAAAASASANTTAARRGADYLAGRQGSDGSVPGGWRVDSVAESIVALVAGGHQGDAVPRAVAFMSEHAAAGATSGPFTGRIVSGLVAVGENPRSFAGTDFVARLEGFYDRVTGDYGGDGIYADTLAMLGLLAAGRPIPDGALTRLRLNQCEEGGWSHRAGCLGNPDTDTTGLAMSVLAVVAGPGDPGVRQARAWLLDAQNPSGGWGLEAGDPDNANSCALALSGVLTLDEDLGAEPWATGDKDPQGTLRNLQLASGAFRYRADVPSANDYATVQAVPALAGWGYPVRAPAAAEGSTTTSPTGGVTRPPVPVARQQGEPAPERAGGPATSNTAATDPADVRAASVPRPEDAAHTVLPWLMTPSAPDGSASRGAEAGAPAGASRSTLRAGPAVPLGAARAGSEEEIPPPLALASAGAVAAMMVACWRQRFRLRTS